jgi:hypothetical protein
MPHALDAAVAVEVVDSSAHPRDGDVMETRANHLKPGAPGLRCDDGKDTIADGHGGRAH